MVSLVVLGFFGVLFLTPQPAAAQVMDWTQVGTSGFGDINNYVIYTLVEYQGNLYTGTSNSNTGVEIWEFDGTDWTQVNTDGFGDVNNVESTALIEFGGKLLVGTTNEVTGPEVWSYDGTDWTQINTDGFGDPTNSMAYNFSIFQDKLYAGIANLATGTEIWQYDGTDWTQVNTDGFGNASNSYSMGMTEYNGSLYVGTFSLVPAQSGTFWKFDGINWTQVGDDGFGNVNNAGIYDEKVISGIMYIATRNDTEGAEIWTFDGTDLVQLENGGFGDANNTTAFSLVKYNHKLFVSTTNNITGTEIWSYDGSTWEQVNEDGFGDAANFSGPLLATNDGWLYGGTIHFLSGAELWRAEAADTAGPAISAQSPAEGSNTAAQDTNISFSLTDAGLEVDSASLNVRVAGQAAITDGEFADGFSGTITNDGAWGFEVEINPDSNFLNGQQVAVTVAVSDTRGNPSNLDWTFNIIGRNSLGIVMTPASKGGPNVRVVDSAGQQISSFFAYDSTLRMGLQVEQADIDGDQTNEIVVTPGQGVESRIKAFELNGQEIASTLTYNEGFTGGVALTTGDFNGDGREEIVVAPISSGGPNVRLYALNAAGDGFTLLDWFFAYQEGFRGGVNLAAGDIIGHDGIDELVVTPRGQGGPNVRVYHYNTVTGNFELVDWVMAYAAGYHGGVQVATGDINGDGQDDIIVSPYLNGGPNIRVYTINEDSKLELLSWVMAYQNSYRGTLSMSVGDIDGDGLGEIVLAPKTLGGPNVRIYRYENGALSLVDWFLPYDEGFRGGVNLFVGDTDGDNMAEVITSPASQGGPNVRVYDLDSGTRILKSWFWAFPQGFRGGVNFGK